jgi:hypothetical protein
MSLTKVCTRCKEEKELSHFGIKGGKEHTRCKKCVNEVQSIYDHKHGLSKKYRHEPKEDLTGRKVGKLTVIENLGTINKRRYWMCECECGAKKKFLHTHLSLERVQSCGCIKKGNTNALWRGHGEISGNRWDMIKRRRRHAEEREFTITIEEVWDLFLKQNRKCALSGIELEFGKTNKDSFTASLDRIDSTKGYTIDNVQWLHKHVNWMKNTFSQEYFVEMCKKITDHHVRYN